MDAELRKYCQRRKAAMLEERRPWESDWKQVSEYMDPLRGRFSGEDGKSAAQKRSRAKIINNRATHALRTMAAGMMSHMTSKARPWFRLTTPDPAMAELADVRIWLDDVTQAIRDALAKSNFYKAMPVLYTEEGMFGTAPMLALEDSSEIIRFYPLTVGTYAIGLNDEQRVDTLWRSYTKTAAQLEKRYGKDALPPAVRQALDSNKDQRFVVQSLTERNPDERPGIGPMGVQAPKYRPYREIVWIDGTENDSHGALDIGGHYEAPFVAARWNPVAEDIYSTSPALDSLGDIKQLQYMEGEKLWLLDLINRPPLGIPESLRNKGAAINPGARVYLPDSQVGLRAGPIYTPDHAGLQSVAAEIAVVERRIEDAFYYSLFLMLDALDDRQRTATEIAERREEKASVLGPTLEALTDEVLDPVVVRTYKIMDRAGLIPEAPPALDSVPLKIEYTSILAQAQRANGISAIERTVQFVAGVAQVSPDVLDKLDVDQTVDEFHSSVGGPAGMLRSDEQVEAIRQQRAQQQQAAQMAQMAPAVKQAADAAKAASEAVPQDGSVMQSLADAMAGNF